MYIFVIFHYYLLECSDNIDYINNTYHGDKSMEFVVIKNKGLLHKNKIYLKEDSWDDWFEYSTMYNVIYVDSKGIEHKIGSLKIGEYNMNTRRPNLPYKFNSLDNKFFSLGQSDTYYYKIKNLGDDLSHMTLY